MRTETINDVIIRYPDNIAFSGDNNYIELILPNSQDAAQTPIVLKSGSFYNEERYAQYISSTGKWICRFELTELLNSTLDQRGGVNTSGIEFDLWHSEYLTSIEIQYVIKGYTLVRDAHRAFSCEYVLNSNLTTSYQVLALKGTDKVYYSENNGALMLAAEGEGIHTIGYNNQMDNVQVYINSVQVANIIGVKLCADDRLLKWVDNSGCFRYLRFKLVAEQASSTIGYTLPDDSSAFVYGGTSYSVRHKSTSEGVTRYDCDADAQALLKTLVLSDSVFLAVGEEWLPITLTTNTWSKGKRDTLKDIEISYIIQNNIW